MTTTAATEQAQRLFNRELSQLELVARVLDLAADEGQPLLERVRFCAIASSILDEFFMVRVAGLTGQNASALAWPPPNWPTPNRAPAATRPPVNELTTRQAKLWKRELRPALAGAGIDVGSVEDCTEKELAQIAARYDREIYPVLTPLGVGPGQPFPYISGL